MAKPAKKPEETFDDLEAALSGATVSKETKGKKSDVPLLQVDSKLQEKAKKLRDKLAERDNIDAEIVVLRGEVFPTVERKRIELCKQAGYISAVRIPTSDGYSLTFAWQHKYKETPLEREASARELLGKNFDQFIEKPFVITVKPELTEDDLKELIRRVGGPKEFGRFMTVKRFLRPTLRYTREFFSAFSEAIRAKLALIFEQYQAACKGK